LHNLLQGEFWRLRLALRNKNTNLPYAHIELMAKRGLPGLYTYFRGVVTFRFHK